MAFDGNPDRPGAFGGELVEPERRQQADHRVGLSQGEQRKVFVGLQRCIGDAVDASPHFEQPTFAGKLADPDPVHGRRAYSEECPRRRHIPRCFPIRSHLELFTICR